MNEFYEDLLSPIVLKWLLAMPHAHKRQCAIQFCNEKYDAKINVHKNNVIELMINDKGTDEQLFYLHFEMTDFNIIKRNVCTFLNYLYTEQDEEKLEVNTSQKIPNILLSCTSGITTSYFAYLMQEALNKEGICINVDAISYTGIDTVQDRYDLILIAPQLEYQYHHLLEKYGPKVMKINTMDFASMNVNHVLNEVIHRDAQ